MARLPEGPARNLLFYQELSAREGARVTGFSYPSAYGRAFHRFFGQSPRDVRAMPRRMQSDAVRPELRPLVALS